MTTKVSIPLSFKIGYLEVVALGLATLLAVGYLLGAPYGLAIIASPVLIARPFWSMVGLAIFGVGLILFGTFWVVLFILAAFWAALLWGLAYAKTVGRTKPVHHLRRV